MLEYAVIILVLGAVLGLALRRKPFVPPKTAPPNARTYNAFERVESLFVNRAEQAFFHALIRALPSGFHLHSKTRLEDIVQVKRSISGEARWRLRGRIKSRHVDYLVTDGQGAPKVAIELDGESHNKMAQNADDLKDGIFSAAGLPLIRVKTGENFADAAQQIIRSIPRR